MRTEGGRVFIGEGPIEEFVGTIGDLLSRPLHGVKSAFVNTAATDYQSLTDQQKEWLLAVAEEEWKLMLGTHRRRVLEGQLKVSAPALEAHLQCICPNS